MIFGGEGNRPRHCGLLVTFARRTIRGDSLWFFFIPLSPRRIMSHASNAPLLITTITERRKKVSNDTNRIVNFPDGIAFLSPRLGIKIADTYDVERTPNPRNSRRIATCPIGTSSLHEHWIAFRLVDRSRIMLASEWHAFNYATGCWINKMGNH